MANDEVKDEYATKDLHFAAFLKLRGMVVKKLEQYGGGGGRNPFYFIFGDREGCEELESIFWGGRGKEATINVREYLTVIRDLRARMFSVNRMVNEKREVS